MKLIKTDYKLKVNESSSFVIYICKDIETANTVREMSQSLINSLKAANKEYYGTVASMECFTACFVPEFFHNKGYYVVKVEHNHGNWVIEPTYDLVIAD